MNCYRGNILCRLPRRLQFYRSKKSCSRPTGAAANREIDNACLICYRGNKSCSTPARGGREPRDQHLVHRGTDRRISFFTAVKTSSGSCERALYATLCRISVFDRLCTIETMNFRHPRQSLQLQRLCLTGLSSPGTQTPEIAGLSK